ncbi:hypothetical protein GQ53DRAFT_420389 [Thozetella sp. PMI_491]|nr:hypothetical protein GQ53DRAFT_420389 [Thozetella sp. PMI_491]
MALLASIDQLWFRTIVPLGSSLRTRTLLLLENSCHAYELYERSRADHTPNPALCLPLVFFPGSGRAVFHFLGSDAKASNLLLRDILTPGLFCLHFVLFLGRACRSPL